METHGSKFKLCLKLTLDEFYGVLSFLARLHILSNPFLIWDFIHNFIVMNFAVCKILTCGIALYPFTYTNLPYESLQIILNHLQAFVFKYLLWWITRNNSQTITSIHIELLRRWIFFLHVKFFYTNATNLYWLF